MEQNEFPAEDVMQPAQPAQPEQARPPRKKRSRKMGATAFLAAFTASCATATARSPVRTSAFSR